MTARKGQELADQGATRKSSHSGGSAARDDALPAPVDPKPATEDASESRFIAHRTSGVASVDTQP